jgi:4-amino-4-deoxy-L-arabinose transferase-like glycosyltransferase
MSERWNRLAWLSVMLVALFHGALYAVYLPPWGMIDEPQHFHYIQYLAEQGSIPLAGETLLSADIVDSMFETQHWKTLHWQAPGSREPQNMGLVGHSYEGYHPPLFYALFVPLYQVLPDDALVRLYALRLAAVGLSLATVWIACRIALEISSGNHAFAWSVGLFLGLLPERAASISRVNNDVLLEVLAAAFVWVCTRAVLRGLTMRRSLSLGLLLGLGVWTKTSMSVLAILLPLIFWMNRRSSKRLLYALTSTGGALVLILPLLAWNLSQYGDLTGYSAFSALYAIPVPSFSWPSLLSAIWNLFGHNWLVWWKGVVAKPGPVVTASYVMLAMLCGYSLAGLVRSWWKQRKTHREERRLQIPVLYAIAVASYGLAVLLSYLSGQIPVIQGRFLLPVVVPFAILFIWGLWHAPYHRILLPLTLLLLTALSLLALFGNLLPYYYYWSAVVAGDIAPWQTSGWQLVWTTFYRRFLSDKPVGGPVLLLIPVLFLASLILTTGVYRRLVRTPDFSSPVWNHPEEA